MAVTPKYQELSLLLPRATVTETALERAAAAASALYEATFDAVAPGSTLGATFQGHDHTPQGGGGPIHRGSQWSMCGIVNLTRLTFSSKEQQLELIAPGSIADLLQIHPSPGLDQTAMLTGWICHWGQHSDKFRLMLDPAGTPWDIDLPVSSGEKPTWTQFRLPVAHPGEWRAHQLYIRCGSYDSANPPTFDIYALQIDELPNVLARRGAPLKKTPAGTGQVVRVAFPALEETLFGVDEFLDSYALRSLYEFANGLHEGIEEKRAPGAASQVCRGHDHDPNSYGGRAIARGCCYTASLADDTYLYRLAYNGATYTGYYAWDFDDGADRRSAASIGQAIFWVGPGLDSSGSPPSGPPYLTARLYVRWSGSGTPTVSIRALHIGTGNYSAVNTFTAAPSLNKWITIDQIPCVGDASNEIQFEVEVTGTSATLDVDLVAFTIYEVPGIGGRIDESGQPVLATGGS